MYMPTLARLPQFVISMYAGDHLPPHFHIRFNDGREALVEIATLQVLRGNVAKREMAQAMQWAMANHTILATKWKELNP